MTVCLRGLAQKLALAAPQPFDQLVPKRGPSSSEDTQTDKVGSRQGRQPVFPRARPRDLRQGPVYACELKGMSAGELKGALAHSLI
jgi:hypothetical protein